MHGTYGAGRALSELREKPLIPENFRSSIGEE
jgi:hypothetical protein